MNVPRAQNGRLVGMLVILFALITPLRSDPIAVTLLRDRVPTAYSRDGRLVAVATRSRLIIKEVGTARINRQMRTSRTICTIWWTLNDSEIWMETCDQTLGLWNLDTAQLYFLDRRRGDEVLDRLRRQETK
jgi:hypothetical protein